MTPELLEELEKEAADKYPYSVKMTGYNFFVDLQRKAWVEGGKTMWGKMNAQIELRDMIIDKIKATPQYKTWTATKLNHP